MHVFLLCVAMCVWMDSCIYVCKRSLQRKMDESNMLKSEVCMNVCIYVYVCVCVSEVCMDAYICMCICMYECMHACMNVFCCVILCLCVRVCVCVSNMLKSEVFVCVVFVYVYACVNECMHA